MWILSESEALSLDYGFQAMISCQVVPITGSSGRLRKSWDIPRHLNMDIPRRGQNVLWNGFSGVRGLE